MVDLATRSKDDAPSAPAPLRHEARNPRAATAWLLVDRVLRIANGVLVASAVARHLGPGEYGRLAVALGTVAVFGSAAGMGADHINTAELSRASATGFRVLGSALAVRLAWSLTVVVGLAAFVQFSKPADPGLYAVLACLVPLTAFTVLGNKVQADGHFLQFTVVSAAALVVGAAVRIAGVAAGMDVRYFAAAAVLDAIVTPTLLGTYLARATGMSLRSLRPDWREATRYFRLCLPTAVSAALVTLYLRVELFAVDHVLGKTSAGLWSAAGMFITPWTMLLSTILPVANRHLVTSRLSNAQHEAAMIRLVRLVVAIALAAVAVNVIAVHVLLPLLLGGRYDGIKDFVWITSLALVPLNLGSLQEIWIAQRRTTMTVLAKVVLGLPLSYGLLVWLAPRWGLTGAAAGMVASYFTTAVIFNLAVDRGFLRLQLRALGVMR